ncbi:SPOR domain-containing protein [Massilia sp. IC2-476]|uniref:SPOR domain-containing protein n=1 Tax=Massilia sp. IC2-476 TaxID=2887199 RepID=UPI001D12624B|nr:SPOR domain-containing protein [Massilia sp. IC2-476]MCC2970592.1 SPOR domain-containing protein [Massilia sp. IC2-476]
MGLFSFGSKNKQDTVRDSGHFVKDDDAAYGQQARSKRASHAGEGATRGRGRAGNDPILPEKKRARRRLVGAIALALAAAVGLPMLLDSEPKPLGTDIAINIPAKDKAAPLPVPAAATVDSGEEIVEPEDTPTAQAQETAPVAAPPAEPAPMRSVDTTRTEAPKPEPVKLEPKRKPEAETHPKAADLEAKKLDKPAAKPVEVKPRHEDAARALAILEDKPAAKVAAGPAQKYVVQVAALATQEKVNELQSRLRAAGVSSFTEKSGDLIRVRVGPYSKEEGEKIRSKLIGMGLSGSLVPL